MNGKNMWQSTQHNYDNGSTMTQREVIKCPLGSNGKTLQKYCVKVTQNRIEQFLLRVHSEEMEIPFHETCVTFTQRKVEKFHLKSESKMCSSQHKVTMRMSEPLRSDIEMLQEPCVTVTQEEWDSFTKRMSKKGTKKCGSPQKVKQRDS